jgi:tetratricopeptide (TPR) repeat protein
LGDVLMFDEQRDAAEAAYACAIRYSVRDPKLMHAAQALCDQKLGEAEKILREHLKVAPTDVAAIGMLAEVAARIGRNRDAETLLTRALALAPGFVPVRAQMAVVLFRLNKAADCLVMLNSLPALDANQRNMLAASLAMTGDAGGAIAVYRDVVKNFAANAKIWMSYGHALRAAGETDEAIAAYRKAIELAPQLGEAYWSLANLKTVPFDADEIMVIETQVVRQDLQPEDRLHFHYALGRALEERGVYEKSFVHYLEGARLRRSQINYRADDTSDLVRRMREVFTPAFLARDFGDAGAAAVPIFIVGLPRSGSTLIEQILASHSAVEGTMELPELPAIVRDLSKRGAYPEGLREIGVEELRQLGRSYLARAELYRRCATRPYFIDKLPNNWMHAGLIQMILPQAKIIDARRAPMAACFSAFKQHFARGQHFSYDFEELARYYRDYAELMAHFDVVSPGRIHQVRYEAMVNDTETEMAQLLEYCGLEFEPGCARFWETKRNVRTASSEQVRRPIFSEGLEQWRNYERFLTPLAQSLTAAHDEIA